MMTWNKSTLESEKTWSVVASSEGHPEHDPHTTYVHVAGRLTRADAVDWVDRIEHEADAALDDCGCDDASDIDGEVRHTCSGYPIVSAFVCLDGEVDRYVTDGRGGMIVRAILLSNKAPSTVIGSGKVLTPVGGPWEPVGRLELPGLSDRLAINARAARLKSLREEAQRLRYEISNTVSELSSLVSRRGRERNGRMIVKVDRWIGRATALRELHAARLGVILPEIARLEGDPEVEARIEAIEEEIRQGERDRNAALRRDAHAVLSQFFDRGRVVLPREDHGPNRQARRADAAKARRRSA